MVVKSAAEITRLVVVVAAAAIGSSIHQLWGTMSH